MAQFFTSDAHFGHESICGPEGFEEGRRIFKTVEEMNETIIKNWNAVVEPQDQVYHLGDFSMKLKRDEVLAIIKRLKGQIILIKGNHDTTKMFNYLERNNYMYAGKPKLVINWIGPKQIKHRGVSMNLTHYPLCIGGRGKLVSIHGHIHSDTMIENYMLNVGMDSPEIPKLPFGQPLTINQVVDAIELKKSTNPVSLFEYLDFKEDAPEWMKAHNKRGEAPVRKKE